jgi:predicted amidohydrolase
MYSEPDNKEANLRRILRYIDLGLEAGANMLVFGECALVGYEQSVRYQELAEPIPGPATDQIADRIKGKSCYVVFGMAEADSSYIYNSAPLIGPDGIVGVARKLYLLNFKSLLTGLTLNESTHFKPGEHISVFDTDFGRIGIQICLDFYHPEVAMAQALAGAWLIVHPAATPFFAATNGQHLPPWDCRPWENSICWFYVCLANQEEQQEGHTFNGGTSIYLGQKGIAKQASIGTAAREEVLEYEVESEDIFKARRAIYHLRDTRPELIEQLLSIAKNVQHGTRL